MHLLRSLSARMIHQTVYGGVCLWISLLTSMLHAVYKTPHTRTPAHPHTHQFMHGPRTFIQLSGQGNGGANGLTVINLGGEPGVHQINATDFSSASFVNAKLRCGKIRKFPSYRESARGR